ncbi:MAG TPA: type II toxin-antitoxin system RelE/ParE family toxin [Candidatus Polarisedimenticolia bacterium]|nr:type II toxin-antitoxin system RelE/ParE family toxin [Candidatus Polarisedimenticolia bacterium]
MKVVWTAQAWERLQAIETFIAQDSPGAATKLVDRLISRADALALHPHRGRRLPEMPASGLRELVVGSYRIVYRRGSKVIEVLTVFEGHRLLRREELPAEP